MGLPKLGIGKSSKVKGQLDVINSEEQSTSDNKRTGCCGGGGCQKTDTKANQCCSSSAAAEATSSAKQPRRPSKKSLAKAKLAAARMAPPPDLAEVYKNTRDAGDAGDGEFDFFGCGGGSDLLQSLNLDEEDDDMMVKAVTSSADTGDIENLGDLASKLLHSMGKV